jgi:hypothetical protein
MRFASEVGSESKAPEMGEPIFEILDGARHYRIYANGRVEGFDNSVRIVNRTNDFINWWLKTYQRNDASPIAIGVSEGGGSQGTAG